MTLGAGLKFDLSPMDGKNDTGKKADEILTQYDVNLF
jgi:hypothetical protein